MLSLKSGLDGSYGETHFIGHDDAVFLLTRASSMGDFDVFELPTHRLPTLRTDAWKSFLHILTPDDRVHEIEMSEEEAASATNMLESLYRKHRAYQPLTGLLHARIHGQTGRERVESLTELGTIYLTQLNAADQAYACFREIHEHQAHRDRGIAGMEKILEHGYLVDTLVPILEERYRNAGNDTKLAWVLSVKAPTLATAQERSATFVEAAELERRVDRPGHALVLIGKALQEVPEARDSLTKLDALAATTGDWSTTLEILEEISREALELSVAREYLVRIVTICVEHLARWERAESASRQLLEIDPEDGEALAALDRVYTETKRWEELTQILERRATLGPNSERISILYRLAAIHRDALADESAACGAFLRILQLDPTQQPAFVGLEEIYRNQNDSLSLRGLFERWLTVQNDVTRHLEIATKLANVCESLEDPEAAIAAWSRALQQREDYAPAHENIVRLLRSTQSTSELIDALVRWARIRTSPGTELFCEAAELARTQLDDAARALDIYLEAHDEGGLGYQQLVVMRGLAAGLNRDEDLARILRELLSCAEVGDQDALTGRLELADLSMRLGRADEAIELWHEVLERDRHNPQAMGRLYDVYSAGEHWAELVELTHRILEITTAPEAREPILLHLAMVYEENLGDLDSAVTVYQTLLAESPGHRAATNGLVAAWTELGAWTEIVALHRERATRAELTADERAQHLGAAARILEDRLDQPGEALTLLLAALALDWRDPLVIAEVLRIAGELGVQARLLETVDALTPAVSEEERVDYFKTVDVLFEEIEETTGDDHLRLHIAHHHHTVRADFQAAIERYREIQGPLRAVAEEHIRACLRHLGAWDELARQLERAAYDDGRSAAQRRASFRELAAIYRDHLDRPDRAKECLDRSKNRTPLWLALIVALLVATGGGLWAWAHVLAGGD